MIMAKFTFKTSKPTGKWKAFDKPYHEIKHNKIVVGEIAEDAPHKIRFMVMKTDTLKNDNPNCKWMWIGFKNQFENIDAAKEFVNKNYQQIIDNYTFPTED
jgi:hypothetical protein